MDGIGPADRKDVDTSWRKDDFLSALDSVIRTKYCSLTVPSCPLSLQFCQAVRTVTCYNAVSFPHLQRVSGGCCEKVISAVSSQQVCMKGG